MKIIISKNKIDFKKLITMGQFFMYHIIEENIFLVQSEDKICKIIINESNSEIISDNISYWESYFALNEDYDSINSYLKKFLSAKKDNKSLNCLQNHSDLRVCNQPYLETCIEYLFSAQSSVERIRKNMLKLLEFGSTKYDNSIGIYYNCFPTIEQLKNISKDDFIKIGAGFRASYLINFIKNYEKIDMNLEYNDLINKLMQYKGIGPKIASCIALYGCKKTDAFPIDVWIQRYVDSYPINKPFIIPDKYAGILQVYIYRDIRK